MTFFVIFFYIYGQFCCLITLHQTLYVFNLSRLNINIYFSVTFFGLFIFTPHRTWTDSAPILSRLCLPFHQRGAFILISVYLFICLNYLFFNLYYSLSSQQTVICYILQKFILSVISVQWMRQILYYSSLLFSIILQISYLNYGFIYFFWSQRL